MTCPCSAAHTLNLISLSVRLAPPIQTVEKPLSLSKMGLRGVAPNGSRGGSPSNIAPFRGKGFGDRDNKSEVYFKNRLFLQSVIGEACPTDFLFIKKLLTNTPMGYIIKIPCEGILKFRSKFRGNTMSENKTSVKSVCPCCRKHTVRDEKHRKALLNRLKRIEGQVRGIEAMIENDAYCNDVLIQSAAVNAAMNAFNKELLASHIRGCVARDIREGKDEVIDELVATLQKLMK